MEINSFQITDELLLEPFPQEQVLETCRRAAMEAFRCAFLADPDISCG